MAYMVKHGRAYDADMMRSFDSMVNRVFGSAGVNLSPFPAVDAREEQDRYVIEVELPGHTQSDVDIQVKDSLLTIASVEVSADEVTDESKEEEKQDSANGRRRHRAFNRQFSLPKDVNREAIEAAFTNGLLIITLTKQPEAQPRKIEIQVN
jgi:HSP20 family protein